VVIPVFSSLNFAQPALSSVGTSRAAHAARDKAHAPTHIKVAKAVDLITRARNSTTMVVWRERTKQQPKDHGLVTDGICELTLWSDPGSEVRERGHMDQLAPIKKSAIAKRSIFINGHKTSISLEDDFWSGLHDVARYKNAPVAKVVEQVDRDRDHVNLSSAIRVFVFNQLRK
jgi:predicted DNA-binding ribbon-helix-helix protein